MTVIYVGIGNSDDKLSQQEWVKFQFDVRDVMREHAVRVIGEWHSHVDSIYQNACFAVYLEERDRNVVPELKGKLAAIARIHRQDSIAWAEAPTTEFLGAS